MAECVDKQTNFVYGDTCKLNFPNEHFDAVTSNYYHNIPSQNRKTIILETLKTIKNGWVFIIHDEFIQIKYGDVNQHVAKFKNNGWTPCHYKLTLYDTKRSLYSGTQNLLFTG